MGIRFYCDHCGKRLNVKSFLAGRKGICPKCGGKIRIPQEDQMAPIGGLEATPDSSPFVSPPFTQPTDTVSTSAEPAPSGSDHEITVPLDPGPPSSQSGVASGSQESFGDVVEAAVETTQAEREEHPPGALWYVRPPSGEQYGPAELARVEQWLDEGRISRDTYVWREGWEEWQFAVDAFPGRFSDDLTDAAPMGEAIDWVQALESATTGSSTTSTPIGTASLAGTALGDTATAGRRRNTMIVGLIALAVVAVALAVTLVVVL